MITIGQVLNSKYRLLRLLGDGGMGAVYEAQHERLGTHVAVKILHSDLTRRPGIVDRFLQEARVSAQIKSPHVVQVTDVEQTSDGLAYLVMELLEGEPLNRVLDREKKLPVATAGSYVLQILDALEAAHALGVVHRDLKPENVFVTTLAGKRVLKLIDFGIAKVRRDGFMAPSGEHVKNLTMAGITMGTPEYMAPEQAFSADQADVRSDVYAVGVMLYEMLSGKRPVAGEDARLIAVKIERGEVTPLIHVAPDTPREIAGLCHRAMAARPELRFQSAAEMRLALEAALQKRASLVANEQPPSEPKNPSTTTQAPFAAPAMELDMAPAPTTQRAGAPLIFASTERGNPANPPFAQIPNDWSPPATRARQQKSNAGRWWLLALAVVLLGGGISIAFFASNRGDTVAPIVPPIQTTAVLGTTTALPTSTTPANTSTALDPLRPLSGTQPYTPPATGTKPVTSADAAAHVIDAGTPTNTPFSFPSGFQMPNFGDAGIPVIPMPSGFQIPTFPGMPPPPTQ